MDAERDGRDTGHCPACGERPVTVRIGTTDPLGGNTVWVAGKPSTLYYYAHLDRFCAGLRVGDRVQAGEVLGFVGDTGNARGTPPHLHFGVYPLTHAFWPVDPAAPTSLSTYRPAPSMGESPRRPGIFHASPLVVVTPQTSPLAFTPSQLMVP